MAMTDRRRGRPLCGAGAGGTGASPRVQWRRGASVGPPRPSGGNSPVGRSRATKDDGGGLACRCHPTLEWRSAGASCSPGCHAGPARPRSQQQVAVGLATAVQGRGRGAPIGCADEGPNRVTIIDSLRWHTPPIQLDRPRAAHAVSEVALSDGASSGDRVAREPAGGSCGVTRTPRVRQGQCRRGSAVLAVLTAR